MARPAARRPEPAQARVAARSRAAPPPSVGRSVVPSVGPSVGRTVGAFVLRNPKALGGGTGFLVALSFVSANAIWYQPHHHTGAFFATRPTVAAEGAMPDARDGKALLRPASVPEPDPTVKRVQSSLKALGVYAGPVDGLPGPNTRQAILAFQGANGLPASGEMDAPLMAALVERTATTEAIPALRPPGGETAPEDGRERVMKIQAGLKAFGNEAIEIDGIMGARTQAAIREFQSLFGLPDTGEPDVALYAKMKEVGLTN